MAYQVELLGCLLQLLQMLSPMSSVTPRRLEESKHLILMRLPQKPAVCMQKELLYNKNT